MPNWLELDRNVSPLSNDDIIKSYIDPVRLNSAVNYLETEFKALLETFLEKRKFLHALQDLQTAINCVSMIHNAVAIDRRFLNKTVGNERYEYRAVSREIERTARIYRNQHNKKTWGLSFQGRRHQHGAGSPTWSSTDRFQGANFMHFDKVERLALDWISVGKDV